MAARPDYENKFLSAAAKRWKPSGIRGLLPLEARPGMISFLAGKPNPDNFPFQSVSLTLTPTPDSAAAPTVLILDGHDLTTGLQYNHTAGITVLTDWLAGLVERWHLKGTEMEALTKEDRWWKMTMGSGSGDVISKTFDSLVDEGDSVLVETPAYAGTIGSLARQNPKLFEIPTDNFGLDPIALREFLTNFSANHPNSPFPKILYTCPTGCNPTGCSSPESRKREILSIIREFDLLLLEDDAYFFLLYDPDKRAKSYFALEAETSSLKGGDGKPAPGRVIRFDSLSKIFSSGMRLGYVTGPKEIVEKVDLNTGNTNLQVSSFTQMIAHKVFQHWGYDGFDAHCQRVANFYKKQCEMFEGFAHKHLDGIASWVSPVAGMFLYIKLDGVEDSFELIRSKALEGGILAVPGESFMPSGSKTGYVRVSFSLATPEHADEGFRRLREVILNAQENK